MKRNILDNQLIEKLLFFSLFFLGTHYLSAQNIEQIRLTKIQSVLDSMSLGIPGLNDTADVSFNDVPLHDFLRTIGETHKINLYVEKSLNESVSNTFTKEPVKNILLFICKKFSLTIEPIGTILSISAFKPPQKPKKQPKPKVLKINYQDNKLSLDLKNDSVLAVIKKISQLTGKTIVPTQGVEGFLSGFIPFSDVSNAIEHLFASNGFEVEMQSGAFYISPIEKSNTSNSPQRQPRKSKTESTLDVQFENGLISLTAEDAPIEDIIKTIFEKTASNFFIYDKLDGTSTLHVENFTLDDLMDFLFQGTPYSFSVKDGIYQIGERTREGLWESRIVKLKYRPSGAALDLVPAKLQEGLELTEYVELNRIIISGDPKKANELEYFLNEIDKPIPMVKIEMLVIDVNVNRLLSSSIRAGLKQPGDSLQVSKEVLPGVDYTLDGKEINTILDATNLPFLKNAGVLKSNFYLQVRAQESQGNIKVVTRPVISTLNGIEANLTIGETQYFKLLTNIATAAAVNPITQVTETLQPIQYNTTLVVTPYISDDQSVTLELAPNFTTPGAQSEPNIPPDVLTRQFSSTIRVKNGETVVLGGLSRDSNSKSSDGVPFLSRIPILKWFFGDNIRSKNKSSLIIYITPTIYYN